jgi:hypothetical protein
VTRRPVSRLGRKLDVVSLIFLVTGASLFLLAFFGMQAIRDQGDAVFKPGAMEAYALLNRYYRLQRLSYLGLGMAATGIAIGLSAAAHNRKFSDPSLRSG